MRRFILFMMVLPLLLVSCGSMSNIQEHNGDGDKRVYEGSAEDEHLRDAVGRQDFQGLGRGLQRGFLT